MKVFPVACGLALALMMSAVSFAADAPTFVRGVIQKIDGNTLTVDSKPVTVADSTVVMINKQAEKIDALAVGQNITARIVDGTAVRVEVHPAAN